MFRDLRQPLAIAGLLWAIALVWSTALHADHAGGSFAGAIYAACSLICHQRPERSFFLWGAQFPVCARCAGIYFGAAAAGLTALVRPARRAPTARSAQVAVALASAPAAATLVYEWATAVTPGHGARLVSGLILGAVVAWVVLANTARQPVGIH